MIDIRCFANGTIELATNRSVAEATAALVDEQWFSFVNNPASPLDTITEIPSDGVSGWPPEGYQSFLPPFASHPDHALIKPDVIEIEGHELADAEAGGIE